MNCIIKTQHILMDFIIIRPYSKPSLCCGFACTFVLLVNCFAIVILSFHIDNWCQKPITERGSEHEFFNRTFLVPCFR